MACNNSRWKAANQLKNCRTRRSTDDGIVEGNDVHYFSKLLDLLVICSVESFRSGVYKLQATNLVWCHLIFVSPQYGTCFTSPR